MRIGTVVTVGAVGLGVWVGYLWWNNYKGRKIQAEVAAENAKRATAALLDHSNCPPGMICGAPAVVQVI